MSGKQGSPRRSLEQDESLQGAPISPSQRHSLPGAQLIRTEQAPARKVRRLEVARRQAGRVTSVADLLDERDRLREMLRLEKRRNRRLSQQLERDASTGILNKTGFVRAMQTAVAHVERFEKPIALVFLDLDGFKSVNDVYGHVVGDRVLGSIAQRFSAGVRKIDVIARLGGDEFAILLWNSGPEVAAKRACQLAAAVVDVAHAYGVASVLLGASFGIVQLDPKRSAEDMVNEADAEMYANKRRRRIALLAGSSAGELPR